MEWPVSETLGESQHSLLSEIHAVHKKWAGQAPFSSDDADRALDSMARFLAAVSAPQADDVHKMKMELRRLTFDEQVRSEKRKAGGTLIEAGATGGLKPWREVVTPHADVASGRYQQAEFAADLWQVYLGQGSDEYKKPEEFFRRTYLTESLKRLLAGAVERLSEKGAIRCPAPDELRRRQKHSMLALFHCSPDKPDRTRGRGSRLAGRGLCSTDASAVSRGDKSRPEPVPGRWNGGATVWGELAYQLGGKKRSRASLRTTNGHQPGDVCASCSSNTVPASC